MLRSIAITFALCLATTTTQSATYQATSLGLMPGGFISATGTGSVHINSQGNMAGAYTGGANGYTNAATATPGGSIAPINQTLGNRWAFGTGINASNHITGYSAVDSDDNHHAFIWNGMTMIDLGTLGGSKSDATAINGFDQVTGESLTSSGERHAMFWDGSQMIDLGTVGGTFSSGRGISDNGMVTGITGTTSVYQAFLWDGIELKGLGTLGGTRSAGNAVNDSGMVAGSSYMAGDATYRATAWLGANTFDLGTLGGQNSNAQSVNSSGMVAGWAETNSGAHHGFAWDGVSIHDLEPLLGDNYAEGWFVNDVGEVFGISTNGNSLKVVKWSTQLSGPIEPVPIPPAAWLFGSALGLLGVVKRWSRSTIQQKP